MMPQKLESASFQSTYTLFWLHKLPCENSKNSKHWYTNEFLMYYNHDLEKNIPYRIEIFVASEISAQIWHEKFLSKTNETNFRHGVAGFVKKAGGGSSGRGFSHPDPTSQLQALQQQKTSFEEEGTNPTPTQTTWKEQKTHHFNLFCSNILQILQKKKKKKKK